MAETEQNYNPEWVLHDYMDGRVLTSVGQRRYAEHHGREMRACIHCYHVEDSERCCVCDSTGLTDDPGWWVR